MLDYGVYLLYRAASALARALPLRWLYAAGSALGFVIWLALPSYRQLARDNLRLAFAGEKSAEEQREIARRHFRRLVANVICGLKFPSLTPEQILAHVTVENVEAMHRCFRSGRPVVLILSHLSNWELFAQTMPHFFGYIRASTVFQKLRNPYLDRHIRAMRARTGLELFDRSEGFQGTIGLLRDGGGVGILSDQHAGDHGIWMPFFGRLASTTPLPALLARRTGAAVIAAAVYAEGSARWRMVFTDPINEKGDSVETLTARMSSVIEQQIRRAPEDWFWVHNRWKTPKPEFLLSRYKRGLHLPNGMEKLKPFRILVRSPNWLGDAVMAVPAVRAIKRGRPDAHVTVAVPARIADVWRLVDAVDEIVPLPERSLFGAARLLRSRGPFDVAILFPNSLRAALESWLAGVPRRAGQRGHHRRLFLNQIIRERELPGPPRHQADRYLRMVHRLGAPTGAADLFAPASPPPAAAGPARIGLCPGAEYGPAKRWLPERFADVVSTLSAESDAEWMIFGTARDRPVAEKIAGLARGRITNLAGRTTLGELIEHLQSCRVLLTNDTGTMHLAALLGVPTVAIFGSTEPRLTGPMGGGHTVLRHHVECSPCFLRECPIDFRCMKAVTAPEVSAAVRALLAAESK